jgi:hypothetical protein
MLVAFEKAGRRAPMLVVKSFGTGIIAGVVGIVLYLVVVMIPVVVAALQSSEGGGVVGFSFSIELAVLVAVVGFLLGFGWTLLKGWVGE